MTAKDSGRAVLRLSPGCAVLPLHSYRRRSLPTRLPPPIALVERRHRSQDNQFGLHKMHPPLTLHRHPMCSEIIEEFQKCHVEHPIGKFFGQCTDLKIKLDRCFRQEKAVKRKANFEESKKFKERLQTYRKEMAQKDI
ncbi:hypothetical protein OPV22_005908 [Ensete ventricosum]|uniref:COX assembly mitochondrial protein n=1 Tax=Ensete ventricosum TaxID=4639 RepID=A0AAV8RK71_ENSVE|nr:hypothetical protein OPV22_005908 [Ensete ventricosum]